METQIKFNEPAHYKITVQGKLTDDIINILGNMRLVSERESDKITITVLEGKIKDQAELSGIIDTLYDWRYPILLVECKGEILNHI